MARLFSSNVSRTYGAQCPDGHGTLLSRTDWIGKLWCPGGDTHIGGKFFADDDPAIKEGPSPDAKARLAAARAEREVSPTRADLESTHADTALGSRIADRLREKPLGGRRPTGQTPPSRAAEPGSGPECLCGCGERTKGGRFRPGHDARYHAAQKKLHAEAHTS